MDYKGYQVKVQADYVTAVSMLYRVTVFCPNGKPVFTTIEKVCRYGFFLFSKSQEKFLAECNLAQSKLLKLGQQYVDVNIGVFNEASR